MLKKMTGSRPRNLQIYKVAFSHRSVPMIDGEGRRVDNERLEFLGDAVLEAVVSNYLFRKYRRAGEGFLTEARSKLVSRAALGRLSKDIGVDNLVRSADKWREHNDHKGGDAFEALFGALYLDRGYRHCQRFFLKMVIDGKIDVEKIVHKEVNFKSGLYEWSQKRHISMEMLSLEERSATDTPVYKTRVLIENVPVGVGRGYSKKESQQHAARQALKKIKNNPRLETHLMEDKYARQVAEDMLWEFRHNRE